MSMRNPVTVKHHILKAPFSLNPVEIYKGGFRLTSLNSVKIITRRSWGNILMIDTGIAHVNKLF